MQQQFVGGGGHFRDKNTVVGVMVLLSPVGIQRMHGVSEFVSQGEHIVERAVEVHKHVGIGIVTAAGIGAGTFTFTFHDIDPAL